MSTLDRRRKGAAPRRLVPLTAAQLESLLELMAEVHYHDPDLLRMPQDAEMAALLLEELRKLRPIQDFELIRIRRVAGEDVP